MDRVKVINLPKIKDKRGNLSIIESINQIPFIISRVYWIYDVPAGEIRGGHAFKEQEEFIVALSGSFDVVLRNGKMEQRFHLNRSSYGVFVPNLIWRYMDNFSTNSVAMVISNKTFDESDYINKYREFLKYISR